MKIQVEKARAEEAEAIWNLRCNALRAQCVGHYDADLLAAWAGSDMPDHFHKEAENNIHVIRDDGRIVAFGLLLLEDSRIAAMFVDPSAFGQGYGRTMLRYLEARAQQSGLKHLQLNASLNAVGFYRACGFVGDTMSKHHSPRGFVLDCVLMEKSIG